MIYREGQLVFSNFVDGWIKKVLYSVFICTNLFADRLTVLCKFSDSIATFNCPRVSVSVTSSGFYSETSKMAGDTGTISGNLPRLFMRVLGWLRLLAAAAAAVGASGCLLRCSTSTTPVRWLRYRTIFHSPARRREARTTRQPRVKVRFAWSAGHPLCSSETVWEGRRGSCWRKSDVWRF